MNATHVLLAVKNPTTVYSYVRSALETGNRVTYLTTISGANLISNISAYWSGVGIYTTSRQLFIQSAHSFFSRVADHDDIASKISHASSTKVLKPESQPIVIICPAAVVEYLKRSLHTSRVESITTDSKVNTIMEFETSVSKRFSNSIVVCCLFERFVQSLDFVHLLILVKYHALAIGHDGKIIPLREEDIVDAIKTGIDVVMGKGSSTLILKTLEYIYHIDEDTIFKDPIKWSNMLRKVCGEHAASPILNAARRALTKLVVPEGEQVS